MARMNKVGVIVGRRGSGKTKYFIGDESLNLTGVLNIYLSKGLKVLIIDTIDHPSYCEVKLIPLGELKDFKKGVCRIYLPADDVHKLAKYINSLPNLWNSLIVFEDATKHTFKNVNKHIRELFVDSKQKNIDVILMYHSFMQIPSDLYNMIDFIDCFKTNDSPEKRESSMPGYYDIANKIWREVTESKNPFFHKLIDATL